VREAGRRPILRRLVVAGLAILAGTCLSSVSAFADACSDSTSQYNAALRSYQSSKFQFPEECARARDYFRAKRELAQLLVSAFNAAKQACGAQFTKDHGPSPEPLVSLLDHEAVTLETGCDVIAGVSVPAPQQPPPAVGPAPVTAIPAPGPTQIAPPPPSQAAAPPPSGPQSCAAQKTMPVAAGCNADFPQRQTGAACAAADNSVGLTLQIPGAEPTCCVTSCGLSK
jgi:hypothetical protein